MSKNQGGGNGKNPELRGGKNSLPKKTTGGVDLKAVAKNGANEAQKKWADKKVVADRPQTKHPKEWTKKIKSEVAKENTTKIHDLGSSKEAPPDENFNANVLT